jgi:dienelactone hydrolase
MRILALEIAVLAATVSVAFGAIRTKVVEYKQGNTALEGYLAWDDAVQGQRPGVLVVHEWMGLGDYAKSRARKLAEMGYIAFAADIYGKGIRPKTPQEAAAQSGIYKKDRQLMRARVQAALDVLRHDPMCDPKRIAAIGYCFGGTCVLELARSGADIAAVVSFHGGLDTPTPADAKNIKCKVLVLHGGDDPHVPPKDVEAFEAEMRAGGVDWQLVVYGGAVHGFTNPGSGDDKSRGAAYDARADRRSWEAMKTFFAEVLKRAAPRRGQNGQSLLRAL